MPNERTQVELELVTLFQKARQDTKKFTDDANKQLAGINMAANFTAIVEGFHLVKETLGGVIDFLGKCSEEAAKAEEGTRLLANSMRLTGEYSQAASDGMQNYADRLAKVTTYSDDAIISSLNLAKSFSLSNLEARQLVAAATDLAAFTGQDLNSATQALAATYNGFISRDLSRMVPALKNLTKTQLENGAAVQLLADKMRGSARDALNSFSGQIKQSDKALEDFQKSIGKFVNAALSDWKRWAGNTLIITKDLFAAIKRDSLTAEAQMQDSLFNVVHEAIRRNAPASLKAILAEDKATANARAARAKADADERAKEELESFKHSFLDKKKELQLRSLDEQGRIEQEFQNDALIIARGYGLGLIKDAKEYLAILYGLKANELKKEQELQIKVRSEAEAAEAKYDEKRKKLYEDGVKNPIKQIIEFGATLNKEQAIGVGAGLLSAITKGAQGAQQLLAKGIGEGLSYALTGTDALSGPISEVVSLLSQGPEKTKQMVQEFARAIPELVKNLAESLPVLIETLVRELPPALAKTMPTVAIGFSTALIKNIPAIVKGFIEGLKEVPKAIVDGIKDALGGLTGGLFGGGGGGGGFLSGVPVVGDIIGGIGDIFGFDQGGTTDRRAVLDHDGGLAKIGSNETIVDSSLTDWLRQLKASGGNLLSSAAQPDVVINIGLQEFARIMFNARKAGYQL